MSIAEYIDYIGAIKESQSSNALDYRVHMYGVVYAFTDADHYSKAWTWLKKARQIPSAFLMRRRQWRGIFTAFL
jgi:hypothetical protein